MVWTTLAELAAAGQALTVEALETHAWAIVTHPDVGIGQHAVLVRTAHGCLLWDPPGYVDDQTVGAVAALGPFVVVAASHPHMFGVQVE